MTDKDKILDQLDPEEIANSFVLPHRLKKSDKRKADYELLEALNKKRFSMSDREKQEMQLLKLKFLLEDLVKGSNP